jgi:hypothetical protein
MKSGNLNFLETSGPLQACNGTALPFTDCLTPHHGLNHKLPRKLKEWCKFSRCAKAKSHETEIVSNKTCLYFSLPCQYHLFKTSHSFIHIMLVTDSPVTQTLQPVHKRKWLSVNTITVDIEPPLLYPHSCASASSYRFPPTALQKHKVTYTGVTTRARVHNLGQATS